MVNQLNKTKLVMLIIMFLVSTAMVFAATASFSDQGTDVKVKSTGLYLDDSNITISIWISMSGGVELYHYTFVNAIQNGSWNVMLGEAPGPNLSLDYGIFYYKDYTINGEDIDFTDNTGATVERQIFKSPLGDIYESDIIDLDHVTDSDVSGWGYIKTYTETDPTYTGSAASGITSGNISDWNTAFGWGNPSGVYMPLSGGTITGDTVIMGSLTVIGSVFNASVTNQVLNGSFYPSIPNTFNIGAPGNHWSSIYAGTLYGYLNYSYIQNAPDFTGWDTNAGDDFDGTWSSLSGIPAGFSDNIDNGTQLTESEIDAYVSNNGYLVISDLTWGNLSGIPVSISDGDNDTLAGLSCSDGQHIRWNSTSNTWECLDITSFTDTVLNESEVDAYVANNGYLTLSNTSGWDMNSSDDFNGSWTGLIGVPAGFADGIDDSALINYTYMIIVNKEGAGDYNTIQGAIDSITNASQDKQYTIKIMPGTYTENITLKDWVDLEGTGGWQSIINGTIIWPADQNTDDGWSNLMTVAVDYIVPGNMEYIIKSERGDHDISNSYFETYGENISWHIFDITNGTTTFYNTEFDYEQIGEAIGSPYDHGIIHANGDSELELFYSEIFMTVEDTTKPIKAITVSSATTTGTTILASEITITNTGANNNETVFFFVDANATENYIISNHVEMYDTGEGIGKIYEMVEAGAEIHSSANTFNVHNYETNLFADITAGSRLISTFDKVDASDGIVGDPTDYDLVSSLSDGSITITESINVGEGIDQEMDLIKMLVGLDPVPVFRYDNDWNGYAALVWDYTLGESTFGIESTNDTSQLIIATTGGDAYNEDQFIDFLANNGSGNVNWIVGQFYPNQDFSFRPQGSLDNSPLKLSHGAPYTIELDKGQAVDEITTEINSSSTDYQLVTAAAIKSYVDSVGTTYTHLSNFTNDVGFTIASDLDWNNLSNIPAGFSDGVDNNTQLTESEVDAYVANNGYLTSANVSGYDTNVSDDFDGAWSSLTGVPAGFSDNIDNDTLAGLSCLDGQHINWNATSNEWECLNITSFVDTNTNCSVSGSCPSIVYTDTYTNLDTNSTDDFDSAWSSLTGVPAGFSDGVDNNTQLTESEVDAYVANNGYLTSANVSGYDTNVSDDFNGSWNALTGIPSGFSDGVDNNTQLSESEVINYIDDEFLRNNGTEIFNGTLHLYGHLTYEDVHIGQVQYKLSTGLISGGGLTINSSNSSFINIAAGSGIYADYSDIDNIVVEYIEWGATSLFSGLSGKRSRWVGVNRISEGVGQLVISDEFTQLQKRTIIVLGRIWGEGNDTITGKGEYATTVYGDAKAFEDLAWTLGTINKEGNLFSPNTGGNLRLDKTAGIAFRYASGHSTSPTSPNVRIDTSSINISSYYYHVQNSTTISTENFIDPDYYDLSGVKTAVPGNNYTIQRVYYFPGSKNVHITYGQALYETMQDAVEGISTEEVNLNEDIIEGSVLRAFIIVKTGTTNLSDSDDADIIPYTGMGLGTGYGVGASVEADPIFTSSDAYSITTTDINNWDTAFGWGNHASANYLDLDTYPNTDTNSTDDFDGAWSSLTGVPAGFSDGVDNNTQLTESEVDAYIANNGYLTSANTTGWDKNESDDFDGAWSSLTAVPAGFSDGIDNNTQLTESEVDAYVANNGYLNSANTTGWDKNEIDDFDGAWSSLTAVPAGFSDGIDNTDDTVNGTELDGVFSTTGILQRTGAVTYSTLSSTGTGDVVRQTSPTINTPALTLATATSTSSGRLFYDTTNDIIGVGDGASIDYFYPSGTMTDTYWCMYSATSGTINCNVVPQNPVTSIGVTAPLATTGGQTPTLSITNDGIGDTQLAYNTGQHLTTTSNVQFNNITVANGRCMGGASGGYICFNSTHTWIG